MFSRKKVLKIYWEMVFFFILFYFFFGGGGGGEKVRKNEEKTLKTGNKYHVTGTLGSTLTYLAIPG